VLGVQVFPEHQLTHEATLWPLAGEDLVLVVGLPVAFCPDDHGVLLGRQLDRVRVHAWEVELNEDGVAAGIRVHRHRAGGVVDPVRELAGQPVDLTERVESHDHRDHPHRKLDYRKP